jgi:hypothetical protein
MVPTGDQNRVAVNIAKAAFIHHSVAIIVDEVAGLGWYTAGPEPTLGTGLSARRTAPGSTTLGRCSVLAVEAGVVIDAAAAVVIPTVAEFAGAGVGIGSAIIAVSTTSAAALNEAIAIKVWTLMDAFASGLHAAIHSAHQTVVADDWDTGHAAIGCGRGLGGIAALHTIAD